MANAHSALAAEIVEMAFKDQAMRGRNLQDGYWDPTLDPTNTARMKQIVAAIGWPTISKVGQDASYKAWLLVQHADRDVEFQEYCLDLIKELSPDDVAPENIAMLTDRVRVNKKLPQIYGTQFRKVDVGHEPCEIDDPAHVDERRRKMGLDTLAENIRQINEKYR